MTINMALNSKKQYETVIGLEVHVELASQTKIFCGCSTSFGAPPNTHTCPVCTGMPGTLPVLNRQVVEYAIAVGIGLNCEIARMCRFDRKNYFYPDNPQNYQISQLYLPICQNGYVEIDTGNGSRRIGIQQIHMEEDAGKLIHDEWGNCSFVDYNRSGVPLIEIVSRPDMRNAGEVIAYLEKLRQVIRYLGASDCKLQEGSMRADVNLSVREAGSRVLGTRTELKNLNSFKAIARAIEAEARRQIECLEEGRSLIQETRRWDDNKETSFSMRSKEDARDYRYFPDPDIPPVFISREWTDKVRSAQPELCQQKMLRYRKEFDLPELDIKILTASIGMAEMFEAVTALGAAPKKVSNWLMADTMRLLKEQGMEIEEIGLKPHHLAALIKMTEDNRIHSGSAREVFRAMCLEGADPEQYVKDHGLETVPDEDALASVVESVLAQNPKSVQDYLGGKEKAIGFLVGQVMKAMKGKADPVSAGELLRKAMSCIGSF